LLWDDPLQNRLLTSAYKPLKPFRISITIDQQNDLQAAAEANHRSAPGRPSNSAAKVASPALLICQEATPLKQVFNLLAAPDAFFHRRFNPSLWALSFKRTRRG
jgi:hypothetical protein